MNIDDFYKELIRNKFDLMFNRNNFNIYQSNNIYLISGLISVKSNILIKHLLDDKSLLDKHESILDIENLSDNCRYMKVKLKSDYIDYPRIDRVEEWTHIKSNNKEYIYSLIKNIPEKIKEKQCLEYVNYIESGFILTVIQEINNSSKIEIIIVDLELNPILIPALMKNMTNILNELEKI